jgi:hypothetical protein
LRLDQLDDLPLAERVEVYLKIQEALTFGDMPPEDEAQPPPESVVMVQRWLGTQVRAAEQEVQVDRPMLIRRMNRAEYDNTIRDLFGVDLKPARVFPEDDSAHGFDNVGQALSVSPLLLEKYLQSARWITDRVIYSERPETRTERWTGAKLAYGKYIERCRQAGRQPEGDVALFFQSGPAPNNIKNHSTYPVAFPRPHFQADSPGRYALRIKTHAVGGGVSEGLRYQIYWETKHLDNFPLGDMAPILRINRDSELLERRYLTREPVVYEFAAQLEPGQEFSYNFENGPPNVNVERVGKDYPGPGMVVHWVEVEGPIFDAWPPASHQQLFYQGPDASMDAAYARGIFAGFARRAYRRPVDASEIDDMLAVFEQQLALGEPFERAVAGGIQLSLCSPSFLYLTEPKHGGKSGRLTDHELAARLSYFLWSSMPDARLFELADQGVLATPEALAAQVTRMLADPKASAFTHNFVGQWLNLRKLDQVAVDEELFPKYSDYLKFLIRRETELFFEEILRQDLSVLNFIDSDFVMINDRLARHYGIAGVSGAEFRRVSLRPEHSRGGLLGHASILTLTTCGTRSSPVMRGAWTLEHILGVEPPPPPKEIPALPPDTKGATTVRERLAKHREDPSCARCHNKMDPLGLALENYNVVGQWRKDYGSFRSWGASPYRPGKPVDAQVTLISGETVSNPAELRAALMKQKERFCHSLVEKLMVYALGRGLTLSDRASVRELGNRLEERYRLRDLILGIVNSETFQSK